MNPYSTGCFQLSFSPFLFYIYWQKHRAIATMCMITKIISQFPCTSNGEDSTVSENAGRNLPRSLCAGGRENAKISPEIDPEVDPAFCPPKLWWHCRRWPHVIPVQIDLLTLTNTTPARLTPKPRWTRWRITAMNSSWLSWPSPAIVTHTTSAVSYFKNNDGKVWPVSMQHQQWQSTIHWLPTA